MHEDHSLIIDEDDIKIKHSLVDLEFHGEIFDRLGLSRTHYNPLNIHVRKEGDPEELCNIFMKPESSVRLAIRSFLFLLKNN